jgi:hypothetical protein|nr:MAG TPA_asm: hypothetical protein [Caudoviricetes sp.]
MTITAQRILTELGNRAWSGFNKDDMVFGNDDAVQALTELNIAFRYLINLESFPFRSKEKTFTTTPNSESVAFPVGQITAIYNAEDKSYLSFIGDNSDYDKEETGKPSSYWVNYRNPNEKIRLYPIPDDEYKYTIVYDQFKPVLTKDGLQAFEFTRADDYINLPSNLEYLFMDCLVLRTMVTNNKDQEDENYVPMKKEFDEAWRNFKKACRPVRTESRCIW